jgi:hypothetical protein
MRNYSDDYADDYTSNYSGTMETRRRGVSGIQVIALVGALTLIAAPAIQAFSRRWRSRHPTALTEPAIDKSLQDTYPASDPPASRFFDIPENRK